MPYFLFGDKLWKTFFCRRDHLCRHITSDYFQYSHIRRLYENCTKSTERIIYPISFSFTCYIDHHLSKLRGHHTDFHITSLSSITLCISIDILTCECDSDIGYSFKMEKIVFRLRFCEFLLLEDSADDIFVLDIYEAHRYSWVLESLLDPETYIWEAELSTVDPECESIFPFRFSYLSYHISGESFLVSLTDKSHHTYRSTDIAKYRTDLNIFIRKRKNSNFISMIEICLFSEKCKKFSKGEFWFTTKSECEEIFRCSRMHGKSI